MIDLHSHILPGLDDGARSFDDSLEIAQAAVAEGVTAIAATPHVRGEIEPDELMRLTLAHSRRYVLLEMPYRGWPRSLPAALSLLRGHGLMAIIAHPERNPEVQDRPDRLADVVRDGALVQITSASLDGRLGRASKTTSHRLLELGLVHLLASDAHGPHVRAVGLAEAVSEVGDEALARFLTVDAPAAIVAGEPVPAPPQP